MEQNEAPLAADELHKINAYWRARTTYRSRKFTCAITPCCAGR